MNRNLLKTMLVSTGLMAGVMGGYADEHELQPTADTYLDWTNKTSNFGNDTELPAGVWQEMWTNATPGLKGFTSNMVLMKFNVKDYIGKITNATLSVTGTNSASNSNTRSIYLGYFDKTDWEEKSITAENSGMYTRDAKKLNIHPFNLSVSIPKGKTQVCTFTSNDLTEYLNSKADANGNVSLIIYGVGQQCSVASKESNTQPVLKIEYSAASLFTATFSETSGLNPEVKVYSDEDHTTEVSASTLSANTTYYYVASLAGYEDAKGSFTVGSENPTITFSMTKKATFAYKVNLVDESGNVIKTIYSNDEAYNGLSVDYSYSKYLTDDNGKVTYVCNENTFSATATPTEAATVSVKYSKYNGVAYLYEADKQLATTEMKSGNYSQGSAFRGFTSSKNVLTVPDTGVYDMTYAVCSNSVGTNTDGSVKTTTLVVNNGESQIANSDITWSVNKILTDGTIKKSSISLTKDDVLSVSASSTNTILDYILLEKANDVATVTDAKYATFAPTHNVTIPAGIKAYTAKVNDANTAVILTEIAANAVIPANTGVVVYAENAENFTFPATTAASSLDVSANELKVSDGTVQGADNIYVMVKKDNDVVFAPVSSSIKVPAGKAYLEVTKATPARFYSISGGNNGTTGIKDIQVNTEKEGAYYTLQGIKTNKPAQGVYIHNGKKVIIK